MSEIGDLNATKEAATREWIEQQKQLGHSEIEEDEISSIAESSIISSSDGDYETEAEEDFDLTNNTLTTTVLGSQYSKYWLFNVKHYYIHFFSVYGINYTAPTDMSVVIENLRQLLNSINSVQTLENVHIENSSNVSIGNVTNINGNIQIIQRIKKQLPLTRRQTSSTKNNNESPITPVSEEQEERVKRDAFIDRISKFLFYHGSLIIIKPIKYS